MLLLSLLYSPAMSFCVCSQQHEVSRYIFEEGFSPGIYGKGRCVFVFGMGAGYKIMDGCIPYGAKQGF